MHLRALLIYIYILLCTDMRMRAIKKGVFCRVLLESLLRVVLVEVDLLVLSVVLLCRNRIGGLSRRDKDVK